MPFLPPRCDALWCRVCRHCVVLLGVVSAATVWSHWCSHRSPGDMRMGASPHRTLACDDVRGRATDGVDLPVAARWSDPARAIALQPLPGWFRSLLQTWVALATANLARRVSERATRGSERRNTAVSGHRIRAVGGSQIRRTAFAQLSGGWR